MWFTVGGLFCWGLVHLVLIVIAVSATRRYLLYYRERFDVDLPIFPEREAMVIVWRPIRTARLQLRYLQILFGKQSQQDVERERQRGIRPLKLGALWLFTGWLVPVLGAVLDKYLS